MSRFYIPSSSQLRSGYWWPISLLLALSLVMIYAICMLFVQPSKPTASAPVPEPVDATDAALVLSRRSETLAASLLQSLVRVTVRKVNTQRPTDDLSILFGESLSLPREDLGSGMFINSSGAVLTNYHVVKGAESIEVVDHLGNRQTATLVGYDALTDLAVVQTPFKQTVPVRWLKSDDINVGSLVWAFGAPFGLENSVSMGIISSSRNSSISSSPFQDFIQTDVATNPGSSGGPLVNVNGLVVGINTAIAGDKFQGVSFALPASLGQKVADELLTSGHIQRGWLGVELSQVDGERARRAGLAQARGVYINAVLSPSDSSLNAGDICLEIEGKSIDDPVVFSRTVASQKVGSELQLVIMRDGDRLPIKVRVLARPRAQDS